MAAWKSELREQTIAFEELTLTELHQSEPVLASQLSKETMILRLPQEAQVCNPDHLKALKASCLKLGVTLIWEEEILQWDETQTGVRVKTAQRELSADRLCLTTGAWTCQFLQQLGLQNGIFPMRGEMLLFNPKAHLLTQVVNEGPRYLVPRKNGLVLAGSTEDEVGFNSSNSLQGIAELQDFCSALTSGINRRKQSKSVGWLETCFL